MVNYNKVLLMKKAKPKGVYLRKNGGNYAVATIYVSVNKENKVTGLSILSDEFNNGYAAIKYKNLPEEYKNRLTNSQRKNSKPEDWYVLFFMGDIIYLNKPLLLERPVRGLRFADDGEINKILRSIVKQYIKEYNITHQDMFHNKNKYPELYALTMRYDFSHILFELEQEDALL